MHVAVTGMHVQCDEQAVVADFGVDRAQLFTQRLQRRAPEHLAQGLFQFVAVGHPYVTPQQHVQQGVAVTHQRLFAGQQDVADPCRRKLALPGGPGSRPGSASVA